jgi:hypothetical protein
LTAGGVEHLLILYILEEQLALGNHTILISGFRKLNQYFCPESGLRLGQLKLVFLDFNAIYAKYDKNFGLHGDLKGHTKPIVGKPTKGIFLSFKKQTIFSILSRYYSLVN